MFLNKAINDNPAMIETAVKFHQDGRIAPNTWLLDLDMIAINAETIAKKAKKLNLTTYFMSKQLNRNPMAVQVIIKKGFDKVVAVDSTCAKILHRYEIPLGHAGHLSQIPRCDIPVIVKMKPEVITIYSYEAAEMISKAVSKAGMVQDLLIKVVDQRDIFFPGQESGIWLDELETIAKKINKLPGIRIVGVTAFPCIRYNVWGTEGFEATPNFKTLIEGADILQEKAGIEVTQINAPGNTSCATLPLLAALGATHVEPGHGVTATTPDHIYNNDLPEKCAMVYVSEISHKFKDKAYAFGGGLYICLAGGPPNYPAKVLVGNMYPEIINNKVSWIKLAQENIDYYAMLTPSSNCKIGDTAIFGFRSQIFYTRAYVAVVGGIISGNPSLLGIFDSGGNLLDADYNPIPHSEALQKIKAVKEMY